jgi:hypothetical protein
VRRIMDATAYRHPVPKPSDGVVSVRLRQVAGLQSAIAKP